MRFITRRVDEGFVIGESLHVTVLEIREHSVRLGFSSPDVEPGYWEEEVALAAACADEHDRELADAIG